MSLPVIIFGGGRISSSKNKLADGIPLSHVAAVKDVPGMHVHAIVEPDKTKHDLIFESWRDVSCYSKSEDVPTIDNHVAVIASTTDTHVPLLSEVLDQRPKMIVVEKPLAIDIENVKPILKKADLFKVPIIVNYNRRFDERFQRLKQALPKRPNSILIEYGKGVFNYASHFIDLVLDWYGKVKSVQALGEYDTKINDPCPSFVLDMHAGFKVFFLGYDNLNYDCLDMNIRCSDCLITLKAGGAEIILEKKVSDIFYRGYGHLRPEKIDKGIVSGFSGLYEFIRISKIFFQMVKQNH